MRKLLSFIVFVCLCSIDASAQIEGYYRLRNGSGVEGKAYLNVQNERLEPTMTDDEAITATSSVFYLKTGKDLRGSGLSALTTPPYYQIEEFTAQGIDGQKTFKDIKTVMQSIPELVFNAVWGIFKTTINANETVKNQIDQINSNYGINLDDFTYAEYQKWVKSFDSNIYLEKNNELLNFFNGEAYRLFINFPNLPDPLRKERKGGLFNLQTFRSQDDLNTAMLIIGPLINLAVKSAIQNNTVVNLVLNENTAPGIFMIIDALDRIQFGERLYLIEDGDNPRFTFAREGSLLDIGSITWAGNKGNWSLQQLSETNVFAVKVNENIRTASGTYITTFYSEFPYRLYDDMKAYVAEEVISSGSVLNRKENVTLKQIAAQGDIVPAKTPVVIETHGTEPTDNRLIPLLSDATFEGTNELLGTLRDKTIILNTDYRILGTNSNKPAFVTPGGLLPAIPENTAYLESSLLRPGTVTFETEVPTVAITPAKEKTTFCSIRNLDFTDSELKAYVVSEITSTHAVLKQVYKVKAGTGLILIGTAGQEYIVPEIAEENAEVVENLLVGTTESITINSGTAYLLSNGVFKKSAYGNILNPGTTLAAGKAYIPASSIPKDAREFTVVFEDDATGITAVEETGKTTDGAAIYDLNGQRVTTPGKGIYVVNGKKMVIK